MRIGKISENEKKIRFNAEIYCTNSVDGKVTQFRSETINYSINLFR